MYNWFRCQIDSCLYSNNHIINFNNQFNTCTIVGNLFENWKFLKIFHIEFLPPFIIYSRTSVIALYNRMVIDMGKTNIYLSIFSLVTEREWTKRKRNGMAKKDLWTRLLLEWQCYLYMRPYDAVLNLCVCIRLCIYDYRVVWVPQGVCDSYGNDSNITPKQRAAMFWFFGVICYISYPAR